MVTISYFSNYLNAHVLPIALELASMPDIDFRFVSLVPGEMNVGKSNLDDAYPFVLKSYSGCKERREAEAHALNDDIAIFQHMAGQEDFVKSRADAGKFFFRAGERILKRGDWWRFVPPKRWRTKDWYLRYKNANMRALCIGSLASRDLELFGFPAHKCLRWGYFPSSVNPMFSCPKNSVSTSALTICSAQRLIPCKHVEMQIQAAADLKSLGIPFSLTIAGDGECRSALENLSAKLNLTDEVQFAGTLCQEEMQRLMLSSDVFLATSDGNEGWGCTINEAMAAGCTVVASDKMGSVGYLISDNVNGLAFRSGDINDLVSKLKIACENPSKRRAMGKQAKETVYGNWGSCCAAKRLVELSQHMLAGKDFAFSDGPLSRCGDCNR